MTIRTQEEQTTEQRLADRTQPVEDFIYQIWVKAREGYMMDVRDDLQTAIEMIDRS